MKKKLILAVLIVSLVSALILGTTAVASAAGSQRWNLDSVDHSVSGKVMEKTGTQAGTVTIVAGNTLLWLSDQAAQGNVTFPMDGGWVVTLVTQENWGSAYNIAVGAYDPNTATFTAFDTTTVTEMSYLNFILVVKVENTDASVPTSDYLALQIGNTHSSNSHTVITNGGSYLVSPITDPGFPLPEVAAGILLGGGLIGLGSYVAIRRKRIGTANKSM